MVSPDRVQHEVNAVHGHGVWLAGDRGGWRHGGVWLRPSYLVRLWGRLPALSGGVSVSFLTQHPVHNPLSLELSLGLGDV